MALQDPGMLLVAIGGIFLGIVGGILFFRKKNVSGHGAKGLPEDFAARLKSAPDKLPEKLMMHLKDEGVNLIPFIAPIWPELSREKREILWSLWDTQGHIDFFIKGLGAKMEEKRVEAARVLMEIKNEKMIAPLLDALESPDQYVPARVAEVLLAYGPDAVAPMVHRLPGLADEAKCLVISILEELGDPRAVPSLLQELSHPAPPVRMKAVDALGEIKDRETVDSLVEMMEDGDWGVRSRAAKALGKMKDSRGIPALEKAAQDEAWWVRTNAREALKEISRSGGKTGALS